MKKKERQKNVLVAILAVFAVGYLAFTLFGGKSRRRPVVRPPAGNVANRPAQAPAPAAATSKAGTSAILVPERPIDLTVVRSQYPRWADSPARDPFLLVAPTIPRTNGLRAADLLTLRAIWRQSGGRYAVINGQMLGEGDRIAGYAIERIEASRVLVRGTNGTENLEFIAGSPGNRTSPAHASAAASPAASGRRSPP